jgi:ABC-type antimicrobial peptide transport system permease subunit
MVLGATRRDVQNMILRQTMQPVAVGMLIGILLAAGVSRVLQGVLFGVSPLDAAAFFGAAVFLTAVAIMASLAPTRRATQIDPVTTLRQE